MSEHAEKLQKIKMFVVGMLHECQDSLDYIWLIISLQLKPEKWVHFLHVERKKMKCLQTIKNYIHEAVT